MLANTLVWVGILNFLMIAGVAYWTTVRETLSKYLPWFNFWCWALLLIIVLATAMFLVWKFLYPSFIAFRNKQEFEHQNLIRKELEGIKEILIIEIKREVEKLREEMKNNSERR